jgi:hypothetical protein
VQIENSKENVLPISSGRNIATLITRLKQSNLAHHDEKDDDFKKEMSSWEERISNESENDDPLELWDDYIKWTQQNATGETRSGYVVELLQRCTRRFQNDSKYLNDIRYLQVWVKYIDTVHDPSDIFEFLEINEIGKDLALLYTTWALVLELKKGMYSEAYNKLEEGLKRRAKPVEQIQFALQQFQHRMNSRTMEAMKDAALGQPAPGNNTKSDCRIFGDEITKSRRLVKPAAPVHSTSSTSVTSFSARNTGAQRAGTNLGAATKSNGGFSVFVDSGMDSGSAETITTSSWNYLPSEKEKVKENMRSATQWTKEAAGTIPVKRAGSAVVAAQRPRAPRAGIDFELFVDEDLDDKSEAAGAVDRKAAQDKALQPVRFRLDGVQGGGAASARRHVHPLEHLEEGSS